MFLNNGILSFWPKLGRKTFSRLQLPETSLKTLHPKKTNKTQKCSKRGSNPRLLVHKTNALTNWATRAITCLATCDRCLSKTTKRTTFTAKWIRVTAITKIQIINPNWCYLRPLWFLLFIFPQFYVLDCVCVLVSCNQSQILQNVIFLEVFLGQIFQIPFLEFVFWSHWNLINSLFSCQVQLKQVRQDCLSCRLLLGSFSSTQRILCRWWGHLPGQLPDQCKSGRLFWLSWFLISVGSSL